MVCLVHEKFWQTIPHDLSRPLIYEAHSEFEAGNILAAACKLREAITMHLRALCEYWDCTPKKPKRPKPTEYLRALKRENRICECAADWMAETLTICNRAVHLERVKPGVIECGICLAAEWIHDSPWAYADLRGGVV